MNQEELTVGQAAKRVGVRIQTLHYYEREKLLSPASRTDAGYRLYGPNEVKRLRFIKQAKELGFTLLEIRELLSLRIRSKASCDKVRRKASVKLEDIQGKILAMKQLERTLKKLILDCENRVVSEACPILKRMEN